MGVVKQLKKAYDQRESALRKKLTTQECNFELEKEELVVQIEGLKRELDLVKKMKRVDFDKDRSEYG